MALNDLRAYSRKWAARWTTAAVVLMSAFVNSLTSAAPWIAFESRFNLRDHDGRTRVRRYVGERCLPECVIERRNGLIPGVMVWGAISYHGRSI
ncbi:hypothetical protein TNCV_1061881 [Trichonephila clavipes]|nr:hypothetical protein TNCV_1061881 [Trichonephila clavipes]